MMLDTSTMAPEHAAYYEQKESKNHAKEIRILIINSVICLLSPLFMQTKRTTLLLCGCMNL